MEWYINLFIVLPFVGFFLSLLIPRKKEVWLSRLSFTTVGIQLFSALFFSILWLLKGAHVINLKEFSIFKAKDYDFYIDFYFDGITLTYLAHVHHYGL